VARFGGLLDRLRQLPPTAQRGRHKHGIGATNLTPAPPWVTRRKTKEEKNVMKRAILLLAIAFLAMATLAACKTATPEAEVPPEGVTTEGTSAVAEEPVSTTTRTGAWVDKVIVSEEPSQDAGVQRLSAGDLDVYAQTISSASTVDAIKAANLKYATSYGSYNEITYNPSACADTTKLNPFAVKRIREATNYLVDRQHIVDEFMGGMGTPRWVAIPSASADRGTMADFIRQMEAK
jgi:hypothetical protein